MLAYRALGGLGYEQGPKRDANKAMEGTVAATVLASMTPGQTVQELGYDSDCDESLRDAIRSACGSHLRDEDTDEVVDTVMLWWRDYDGDLTDALVDAIGPLADHGVIWLLTPKPGREGHVASEDIADSAPSAGLQQTSTVNAAPNWQGTRLIAPRAARAG